MRIKVVKTRECSQLPFVASPGSSGADVFACIDNDLIIKPGERLLIPIGLRIQIPRGYEIQVRPRSGLALKEGLTVLNTPGTIDSDYRGEIAVILFNAGECPIIIKPQMRIAQIVLCPVYSMQFEEVETLDFSNRGEGGFGSSGRK